MQNRERGRGHVRQVHVSRARGSAIGEERKEWCGVDGQVWRERSHGPPLQADGGEGVGTPQVEPLVEPYESEEESRRHPQATRERENKEDANYSAIHVAQLIIFHK